jgi:uncharacterized protein YdeI (BOF family)
MKNFEKRGVSFAIAKLKAIIALAIMASFSMAACAGLIGTGDGGGGGNSASSAASSASASSASVAAANTSLNGTWTGKVNKNTYQMSFKDGSYSVLTNGLNSERGTYTSTGKSMTMTASHAHGDWITANGFEIAKKWHTQTELEAALKGKMTDANIARTSKNFFTPQKIEYTVKDDKLSWRGPWGSLNFKRTI